MIRSVFSPLYLVPFFDRFFSSFYPFSPTLPTSSPSFTAFLPPSFYVQLPSLLHRTLSGHSYSGQPCFTYSCRVMYLPFSRAHDYSSLISPQLPNPLDYPSPSSSYFLSPPPHLFPFVPPFLISTLTSLFSFLYLYYLLPLPHIYPLLPPLSHHRPLFLSQSTPHLPYPLHLQLSFSFSLVRPPPYAGTLTFSSRSPFAIPPMALSPPPFPSLSHSNPSNLSFPLF